MTRREIEITYRGTPLMVSAMVSEKSDSWLVCLHGIQSNKQLFVEFASQPWASEYSVLAMDFIGFGDSVKPAEFSYDVADQAQVCQLVMAELGITQAHVVGHSLGGMVGTLLLESNDELVVSLTSLEGNLVYADCGASAQTVAKPYDEFRREYPAFIDRIRHSSSPSAQRRAAAVEQVPDYAFYRTAQSIVEWSKSEKLLTALNRAEVPRLFVYGETNAYKADVLSPEVVTAQIPRTGHFMLAEEPVATLAAIGGFLEGQRS